LPPVDHAAARVLVSAVHELNAVAAVLLETANTFDECAGALGDRDPVILWRTATLARTAAVQLMLSLVGIDTGIPSPPAASASDDEKGLGSPESSDQSAFLRFAHGPPADRKRKPQ
jgi:hypothetical protein